MRSLPKQLAVATKAKNTELLSFFQFLLRFFQALLDSFATCQLQDCIILQGIHISSLLLDQTGLKVVPSYKNMKWSSKIWSEDFVLFVDVSMFSHVCPPHKMGIMSYSHFGCKDTP